MDKVSPNNNNKKTDLNLSVENTTIIIKAIKISNERKEKKHQDGNPVLSNMTYSGGESSPTIH
jgi:hypothetical protein